MAIGIHQSQQLQITQHLIMTPQLQMAIKLLQLSRLELMDVIRQELEENPALEEDMSQDQDSLTALSDGEEYSKPEELPEVKEVTIEDKIADDLDWSNYLDEYNSPGKVHFESEEKESPRFETFISSKESLGSHLLWQLRMTFPDDDERRIGNIIIGNLNRDGYLDLSVAEIAKMSETTQEKAEKALKLIQSFDPTGVAARDLKECLLIQIERLGLSGSIVERIISDHMNHLENKNFKAISRSLKISIEDVITAVNIIKGLEPRPGRQFSDEEPIYITPDIYVYKWENEFVIVLNDDGMPKLKVNPLYKNAAAKGTSINDSAKDYLQEKMRSAAWLIRSIHQRQKTIYKVMESIVKYQRDFFEKGVAHLKPMVLRDVAQDISMHESTISRVTTNKYAYTPQGIFELKFFFNSSINRMHGGAIASASVQEKIKQIIENENPKKPMSDDKISQILKESNINIARRTVAKYREMIGVLPSNKRKQY